MSVRPSMRNYSDVVGSFWNQILAIDKYKNCLSYIHTNFQSRPLTAELLLTKCYGNCSVIIIWVMPSFGLDPLISVGSIWP